MVPRLKFTVLPQHWGGQCWWRGQGAHGLCTGAACRHHVESAERCSLDVVARNPGGLSHQRVGDVLGISDVQVVKDEARAIAKLYERALEFDRPEVSGHDPYSGIADNGAREASELWKILKRRRAAAGSRAQRGR